MSKSGKSIQNQLRSNVPLREGTEGDGILTSGVERGGGANAGPDGSLETHGLRDRADTVVNIAVGRAPEGGGDTEHVLDDLLAPAELGDKALSGHGRHRRVAPSMRRKLVPGHVLLLQQRRIANRARADDEERRLETVRVQVVEQVCLSRGVSMLRLKSWLMMESTDQWSTAMGHRRN